MVQTAAVHTWLPPSHRLWFLHLAESSWTLESGFKAQLDGRWWRVLTQGIHGFVRLFFLGFLYRQLFIYVCIFIYMYIFIWFTLQKSQQELTFVLSISFWPLREPWGFRLTKLKPSMWLTPTYRESLWLTDHLGTDSLCAFNHLASKHPQPQTSLEAQHLQLRMGKGMENSLWSKLPKSWERVFG